MGAEMSDRHESLLRRWVEQVRDRDQKGDEKLLWAKDGEFERFDSLSEAMRYARSACELERMFGAGTWDYITQELSEF